MERRVFIAVLLSFVVLYRYQTYFAPPPPPPTGEAASVVVRARDGCGRRQRRRAGADALPRRRPRPRPAEVKALLGESEPREITVETPTAQRRLHQSRRARPALAAQGLSRRRRPTGRSGAVRAARGGAASVLAAGGRRPATPRASTTRSIGSRATPTAFVDVDADQPAARVRVPGRERTARAQGVPLRSAELHADGDGHRQRGDTPLNPAIAWGPGLGDQGAAAGRRQLLHRQCRPAAARLIHRGGRRRAALRPTTSPRAPAHEGQFRFVGVDDHYFVSSPSAISTGHAEFKPLTLPGANDTAARSSSRTRSKPAAPGRPSGSSSAPSSSTICRRCGPDCTARSTSASSPGWSCRCWHAEVAVSDSSATTAGRSSC